MSDSMDRNPLIFSIERVDNPVRADSKLVGARKPGGKGFVGYAVEVPSEPFNLAEDSAPYRGVKAGQAFLSLRRDDDGIGY